MFEKKSECVHNWKEISKEVLPSAFEQVNYNDQMFTKIRGCSGTELFRKKVVIVIACKKCGKLEKIVEENP